MISKYHSEDPKNKRFIFIFVGFLYNKWKKKKSGYETSLYKK